MIWQLSASNASIKILRGGTRVRVGVAEDLERWQRHEPVLARVRRANPSSVPMGGKKSALTALIAGLGVGMAVTLVLLARTREEGAQKSVALAILRTETARQTPGNLDVAKPVFCHQFRRRWRPWLASNRRN